MSTDRIRSPHDVPQLPLKVLVERWSEARMRTALAARCLDDEPDPDALFTQLVYGVRVADEVTSGRWCVVADLLRLGAVDSWSQVGTALAVSETEARDGFRGWIAGQVDLRQWTGTLGLTDAEATELYALSEAVSW